MKSSVKIRKARREELHIVQELNFQLFVHDQEFDPLLNMKWTFGKEGTEYFTKRISGEEGVCFVAEHAEEVVGYLAGGIIAPYSYRTIAKQSELENILVQESFRKKGVGEKLFAAFVKWSKEQGAERIKVSAAAQNNGAISFYQNVGFVSYATELEYEI